MSSWVRALRWQILLTAEKHIPTRNVFWANMAGYLGNNILPARAGELIRATYVSKENNLSVSYSLATGLVERFIDLVALVILGSTSLAIAGILSDPLQGALKVMSGIAIVGIIALLVMPYIGGRLRRILAALPLVSLSAKEKIGGLLKQFVRGLEALHHPKRAAAFILFTSLIWLIDGIGVIILARALHLQFTLTESFLLLAAIGLSSAIPSTPGYIGVYQFAAVIVLQPFGISKTSAVTFIIFLQVASILIVALWGGLAIWRISALAKAKP
jgi:glycosyltransferase 2 family protein